MREVLSPLATGFWAVMGQRVTRPRCSACRIRRIEGNPNAGRQTVRGSVQAAGLGPTIRSPLRSCTPPTRTDGNMEATSTGFFPKKDLPIVVNSRGLTPIGLALAATSLSALLIKDHSKSVA